MRIKKQLVIPYLVMLNRVYCGGSVLDKLGEALVGIIIIR